jgi:uncharacterized protein involved in exopolysaccharide biosynthesis/Mrp family chromosome partitioning ATPase
MIRREILSFEDLVVSLRRHWKSGLAVGAAVAVPVLVLLVGRTPVYRSESAIRVVVTRDHSLPFVQNEVPENSALHFVKNHKLGLTTRAYQEYFYDRLEPEDREAFLMDLGFSKPPVARAIAFLKSLPDRALAWTRPSPGAEADFEAEREAFLKKLNESTLAVTEMKETHVLRVSAKSPNRELAARLANGYAQYYAEFLAFRERERARERYEFLRRRETEYREQARLSRQELNRFRLEHDVLDSHDLAAAGGDEVKRLNEQRAAIRVEYTAVEAALLQAERTEREGGSLLSVREIADAPNVRDHYREILRLQQEHAANLSLYGAQHHLVKQSAERVKSLEAMLEEEARRALAQFQTVRSSAGQKLAALEAELQKVMGRVFAADENALELSSLVARAESDQKTYDQILEKLNQVKVEMEIPHTSQVVVEDKAVPAEKPFRPDKPMSMVLAGLIFGGLFLGVPVAMGFTEDVSRKFSVRLPVVHRDLPPDLGQVPVVPGNGNLQMLAEAFGPGASRDALYRLAFEVERVAGSLAHRCLLVTSAEEREGKSFLAAALGGVYCSQGKKTLVVDCNLRSPSLGFWFPHLASGSGLADWLREGGLPGTAPECRRHGASDLHVLTSRGWVTDPVSLLSKAAFADWLRRVREEYDVVILDGPHVNGLGDVAALAPLVQGVLLVSDRRISGWKEVLAACRALRTAGATVLGLAGNRHE